MRDLQLVYSLGTSDEIGLTVHRAQVNRSVRRMVLVWYISQYITMILDTSAFRNVRSKNAKSTNVKDFFFSNTNVSKF